MIKYKICNKCKKKKPISEFGNHKNYKDGLRPECKKCHNEEMYIARQLDRNKYRKQTAQYRLEHPEFNKGYYHNNPEYFETYREQSKGHYKQWRINNREHLNEWRNNKRKSDINFKVTANLRSRLSTLVRHNKKSASTMQLLGCSIEEFKQHIESKFQSGMSWDNYGKWHLDHIIPCAKFNLVLPKDQQICFHYSNFQPLWAIDNLRKNKY